MHAFYIFIKQHNMPSMLIKLQILHTNILPIMCFTLFPQLNFTKMLKMSITLYKLQYRLNVQLYCLYKLLTIILFKLIKESMSSM